ncbi:1-phosphofructokinase family hexose kinase [Gulosibacter sp. 10]|uniref:1-phosphofructokinase family hexose kinase n=1 Tax=Gulosibacter sp. 10 TaxID=1255570 RepID=UPI00097EE606|nr:1-phosphofructokinase family hexose kinase [Gulosibacter sp. 10]SJM60581.1 1-phosphofructokinase [Gulosibacter sp. 10]
MIVTVTANPSIDRTIAVDGAVVRGEVHRTGAPGDISAGKGINVARALRAAEVETVAVYPAPEAHPFAAGVAALGLDSRRTPAEDVRVNLTVVEPDGTTTKFNAPGAPLEGQRAEALEAAVLDLAAQADWVVLAGSLPPGLPEDWYVRLVPRLRELGARIAVDTSGAPLAAFTGAEHLPDLMKPNAHELASLVGGDGDRLEAAAERGDFAEALEATGRLVERGAGAVLLTLGAAGAVLATAEGAWFASPPPIVPRSTVGAGDSSLAGYLIARARGEAEPQALRRAVAYGSAAASLEGTGIPVPADLDLERTPVRALADSNPSDPPEPGVVKGTPS